MTIKVLIVDDSALMRRTIRQAFEAEGDFETFQARDGLEALERVRTLRPDVMTLDINMPGMDGLTCLSHIMTEMPLPVVMVSSLTEKGALATFEALEIGAVDYVPKPDGTISLRLAEVIPQLVAKVRAAAGARTDGGALHRVRKVRERKARATRTATTAAVHGAVLIGVSTGGPKTLEEMLPELPGNFPLPVLVAQHMPANFTRVFAERMGSLSQVPVLEVSRPEPLRPGHVYVGQGGSDIVIERRLGRLVALAAEEDASLWHPSVSRLVSSAMEVLPPEALIGVQLTGMGDDGAAEMADLRRRGGHTIAESEASSIVFGMPRELIEKNGASEVLDAPDIADRLIQLAFRMATPKGARAAVR